MLLSEITQENRTDRNDPLIISDQEIIVDQLISLTGDIRFSRCRFAQSESKSRSILISCAASVSFEDCSFSCDLSIQPAALIQPVPQSIVRFTACRMENVNSLVDASSGELTFEKCEFVYGEESPRESEPRPVGSVQQKHNRIRCFPILYDSCEIKFEECLFQNNAPQRAEVLIKAQNGSFVACQFSGIDHIVAAYLVNCKMVSCVKVSLNGRRSYSGASNCNFDNCLEICCQKSILSNCEISQMNGLVRLRNSSADYCKFRNISCSNGSAIELAESSLNISFFEGVRLLDGAYLISAIGTSILKE